MISKETMEAALKLARSVEADRQAQDALDEAAIRRAGFALDAFLRSDQGKLVFKVLAAKAAKIEIAREETAVRGAVVGKKKQPKTTWVGSWILDGRGLGHEFPGFGGTVQWLELRPEEAVMRAFRNRTPSIRPEQFMSWLSGEITRAISS